MASQPAYLLAAQRAQSGGGSSRTAARRRVAAQAALGGSSTAQPLQVNPPQIRTSDGKMGPAIQPTGAMDSALAKQRAAAGQEKTQQSMSRHDYFLQGQRDQAFAGREMPGPLGSGSSSQGIQQTTTATDRATALEKDLIARGWTPEMAKQRALMSIPPGQRPGVSSVGQQPTTGPVTQGPQDNGPTDFAGLRKQIEAFGPAPTLDAATLAKMRAQESMRLANIQRGNLAGLGAAAAGQGGVGSGGVASIAAGFGAERMRAETDLGVKYAGLQNQQAREDYNRNFGLAGDLAKLREQQAYGTSERMGSQAYNSEEAQKNRAFAGDQNAQDRLASMALAEKNIAAQKANLDTQIAAASAENNLDRVQQLTMQRNQLDQNEKQMAQQNDQFLASIGLDRDRFNKASEQFDLTRGDQVAQFASNLDLQNRQMEQQGNQFTANLAQNLTIANMDDATRRWMTQLQADMNNPTEFQAALSALGTIASIPGLGERIFGGLGGLFGGSGGQGQPNYQDMLDGSADPFTATGGTGGAGGISNLAAGGAAALAAGGAAAIIDKAFEPGSSEWWDVAAGQIMGGALGSAFGGIVGFGRDAQQAAQEKFTTAFDKAYQGLEQGGFLQKPPTDPDSFWNPAVRASIAKGFEKAVAESAKIGTSAQEISEPDWQRMERLGLGAVVNGTDRSRHYLVDDPRITAILGKDATSQWLTFELAGRNDDTNYAQLGGSLKKMIERGGVTVRDKKTGEIIDLNNPEQLKAIAARNSGGGVA